MILPLGTYNPETGAGCCGPREEHSGLLLPCAMVKENPGVDSLDAHALEMLRVRYDFEYWCWLCVKITDKVTGRMIPFVLNSPQRKMLALLESQRLARRPIRVILLKSRQWGGSTLTQIYIAWHQLVLHEGRNSVIVGHKRNSGYAIKQMFRNLLKNYPQEMMPAGEEPYQFKNVPDSKDIQELKGRECCICLTSSYSPDAVRGLNLSYAHLSEVAFWTAKRNSDPNDLIRSILGTITLQENTIVVLESTANGVNSFFYNEWKRAVEGKSDYTPLFVGWHEIELYSKPLDEGYREEELDSYEKNLLIEGKSPEQVYWYHCKRREFTDQALLKAEFPTTPDEAFEYSMEHVFSLHEQERIVENADDNYSIDEDGLKVWSEPTSSRDIVKDEYMYFGRSRLKMPRPYAMGVKSRYMAVLTIGSEKYKEKPSVFSVWRIDSTAGTPPELSAQWTGNKPLNLLAVAVKKWATRYDEALLVVENNDIDCGLNDSQQGVFVCNELFEEYRNLYRENKRETAFEVNRKRISLIFHELIMASRLSSYIDKDREAAQTIARMISMPSGKYYPESSNGMNLLLNRGEMLYMFRLIKI